MTLEGASVGPLALTKVSARAVITGFLAETTVTLTFRNERDERRYRMYISGDTRVFRDLREIPRLYPNIDLMLLHLGGARAMGALLTMNAEQGIDAIRIIRPELTIPIHYNDYDMLREPLVEFVRAVQRAGLQDQVRYLYHGETYSFLPRGILREARPLV